MVRRYTNSGTRCINFMYGQEGETLTLAAAGDAIITRKLSVIEDSRFEQVIDKLRSADASFVNLEVLLHEFEGAPQADWPGTYMRAPAWAADELKWAGFDLFAAATNHANDFSHEGLRATMRELNERDLVYAGIGENLAMARKPAYLDTPAGRIALVSACSSIPPGAAAGTQRPDMQGRPGISPLRLKHRYTVPEEAYEYVRTISDQLGLESVKDHFDRIGFPIPDDDTFTLLNTGGDDIEFECGSEFNIHTETDDTDTTEIQKQISAASKQADWVVASLHAHQGQNGMSNDHSVPDWFESFAHSCIDAGADVMVGHGPHLLRGIEIYDGAPIFYSLGNFLMQNETIPRLPADIYELYGLDADALPADVYDTRVFDDDGEPIGFLADSAFWESVLPVCEFEDGELCRIDLYPLDLGHGSPRPQRGRPLLVTGESAAHILNDLMELSRPYSTKIQFDNGVGTIVL